MRTEFGPGTSPVTSGTSVDVHILNVEGGEVLLPSREVMLEGMYTRNGADLVITSPEDGKFIVKGFFLSDTPPTLTDGGDTHISGDMAAEFAGPIGVDQYAGQTSAASASIGQVRSLIGVATVTRADGTVVTLKIGDPLYLDDIVETTPGAQIGLILIDGTALALGERGELVLDDLVYDPSTKNGKAALSLVSGAAEFVSGSIAKSGQDNMTFKTPVGTIGIRGTKVFASYDPVSGEVTILNRPTGTGPNGQVLAGEITLTLPNGQVIGNMTAGDNGWQWNAAQGQTPQAVQLTPAQVQNLVSGVQATVNNLQQIQQQQQQQQQNNTGTPDQGGGQGAAPGGDQGGDQGGQGGGDGQGGDGQGGDGTPGDTTTDTTTVTPTIVTVTTTTNTVGQTTFNIGPAANNANTAAFSPTQTGTTTVVTAPPPVVVPPPPPPPVVTQLPVQVALSGGGTVSDQGSNVAIFTITRTGDITATVTVGYTTVAGTAAAGSDFTAVAGSVTFQPGELTKQIIVPILNVGRTEVAETFSLQLTSASGATTTLGTATAPVTIQADAALPTISIGNATVTDTAAGTATVTVTRTGALYAPSTVSYTIAGGTAEAGTDFNGTPGTITFAAGQSTATITVQILANSTPLTAANREGDETFSIILSNPVDATITGNTGTVTITADAAPATFTITGGAASEGGVATVTVTRSGGLTGAASVNYQFVNGTAFAATDFSGTGGTLTFAANETIKTITIPITKDDTTEEAESFSVVLSNPIGGTIVTGTATVNINADPIPLETSFTVAQALANLASLSGRGITISDTATIAQLKTIKAGLGTGSVVATSITDFANLIIRSPEFATGAVNLTFNGTVGVEALQILDALTTGTLTYTRVTGTSLQLTNGLSYITGAVDVDIQGAGLGLTSGQLAAIDGMTTGVITLVDTTANLIANPNGVIGGAYSLLVTTPASIAQLAILDGMVSGTFNYTGISDTAANIIADGGTYVNGAHPITLPGSALASQITTISGMTTGTITVSDFAANLTSVSYGSATVIITGTVTPSEVSTITAKTTGQVFVANDASVLFANSGGFISGNVGVIVTTAATLSQLAAIDAFTTGPIVYNNITDTPANLAANAGGYLSTSVTSPIIVSLGVPTTGQLAAISAVLLQPLVIADTAANLMANLSALVTVSRYFIPSVSSQATIAQLQALESATPFPVGYGAITDTAANLAANVGGFVNTNRVITISDSPTIAQIAAIDAFITGVPIFTSVADTYANLTGNPGSYLMASTNVKATDAVTLTQLKALDAAFGTVLATTVADTTQNILRIGDYFTPSTNVTFTEGASAEVLVALDALTTGTITYTTIIGPASRLLGSAAPYVAGKNVEINAAFGLTPSQVVSIDAMTTGTITIFGPVTVLAANDGGFIHGAYNVKTADPASIAQLTAIDGYSTGTFTYGAVSDNAANLLSSGATYINGTHNVIVTGEVTLPQLGTLDGLTSGTITVQDTAANLITSAGYGSYDVVIVGATTAANITTIRSLATSVSISDTGAVLAANNVGGAFITGDLKVIVSGAATIAQLTAIDGFTTGTVTYTQVVDTAANLIANAGGYVTSNMIVIVNAIAGPVTAADLEAIGAITSGAVILLDTAANLAADAGNYVSDQPFVIPTVQGSATLAQLAVIDAHTPLPVGYNTIVDTAANLTANAGGYVNAAHPVTVTNAATIAQLNTIDGLTTGAVTYTHISDTSANIIANAGGYVTGSVEVTVTNQISPSDYDLIDALTTGNINYTPLPGVNPPVIAGIYGNNAYAQLQGDSLETASSTGPVGDHTMEAWIRTTVDDTVMDVTGIHNSAEMALNNGKVRVTLTSGGQTKIVETTATVADGDWHHIGYSFDDATGAIRIYIDGEVVSSAQAGGNVAVNANFSSTFTANDTFRVGVPNDYSGDLADVRLWTTTRSDAQIEANYNVAQQANATGLQIYYTFNDFIGDEGSGVDTAPNQATAGGSGLNGLSAGGTDELKAIEPDGGQALHFSTDTTGTSVNTHILGLAGNFTLTAGIRLTSEVGTHVEDRTIFGKARTGSDSGTPDDDFELHVYVDQANIVHFQLSYTQGGLAKVAEVESTVAVESQGWHNVAVSYDAFTREMKIYLDGADVSGTQMADGAPGIFPAAPSAQRLLGGMPLELGLLNYDGDDLFFEGDMTRVTVWETTLPQGAIDALTSAGPLPDLTLEGLLAAYSFSDGVGPTVSDSVTSSLFDGAIDGPVNWIMPSPPIAQSGTHFETVEDTPVSFRLVVTDIDGDSLSYSTASSTNGGGVLHLGNGLIQYTPPSNFDGADSFTITVSDGSNPVNKTFTVNVAEVNDVPLLLNLNSIANVMGGDMNPAGQAVVDIFSGDFFDSDDSDGFLDYIVVIGNPTFFTTNVGTWEYSNDGGTHWYDVGNVNNAGGGLILAATSQLRFVPDAMFTSGSPPSLVVRALDSVYTGDTSGFDGSAEDRVTVGPQLAGTQILLGPPTPILVTVDPGPMPPVVLAVAHENAYAQFDGVDDRMESAASVTVTSHSQEAWMRSNDGGAGLHVLSSVFEDVTHYATMFLENGKLVVKLVSSAGVKAYISSDTLSDGDWHHVAYSYDNVSDELIVYVDGDVDASVLKVFDQDLTGFSINGTIRVGGDPSNNWFKGSLDGIRVWDDVRTLHEIASNRGEQFSGGALSDLIGSYNFNYFDGSTLYNDDDSGANNLDIYGDMKLPISGQPTALHFDGVDDYVATALNTLSESFSFEARIRLDGDSGLRPIVSKNAPGGNALEFMFLVNEDNILEIRMGDGTTITPHIGSFTLEKDLWYDVAVTYNHAGGSDNLKLYVNGVEDDSFTFSPAGRQDSASQVLLARTVISGTPTHFSGDIGSVFIWDTALLSGAINNHIENGTNLQSPGLVSGYQFSEGQDFFAGPNKILFDGSSNAHAGIIMGNPTWFFDAPPSNTGTTLYTDENVPVFFKIFAEDPDALGLTYSIEGTPASYGVVSFNQDGTVQYVPDGNFDGGTDYFTIRITASDSEYIDVPISIVVNAVNDRPRFTQNVTFTIDEGDTASAGMSVEDLLGTYYIDEEGANFSGIVVVGVEDQGTYGDYEYYDDSNDAWVTMPMVDNGSNGLILSTDALIRFVATSPSYSGNPGALKVRALDSSYSPSHFSDTYGSPVTVAGKPLSLGNIAKLGAIVVNLHGWDDGGGDGLWATAANWETDTLPGSSDRAVIDNDQVTYASGATTVSQVRLESASQLTISGGVLTVSDGVRVEDSSTLIISGSGSLVNNGALNNNAGSTITLNTSAVSIGGTGTILNVGAMNLGATGEVRAGGNTDNSDYYQYGSFSYQESDVGFKNQGTMGTPATLVFSGANYDMKIGGVFVNDTYGVVHLTSSTNTATEVDFLDANANDSMVVNSGTFETLVGGGGARTLRYTDFHNVSGGRLIVRADTTLEGRLFDTSNSSAGILIANGVTLTLGTGEMKLNTNTSTISNPGAMGPTYPLGSPPLGGISTGKLLVKGGAAMNTEDNFKVPRSGGAFTIQVGEQGGTNALWRGYGGSGFAYTIDVAGIINMYSAAMDVGTDILNGGIVNVIDASGTGVGTADAVTLKRGFVVISGGALNIEATTSASTLKVQAYTDDGSDGNSSDASVSSASNDGTISLISNAASANIIFDGVTFSNSGVIAAHGTQVSNLSFINGATFRNSNGDLQVAAANTSAYSRFNFVGNAPLSGTLALVSAGFTAPSVGDSYTVLTWSGSRLGMLDNITGIVSADLSTAFDPVFSSGALTLTAKAITIDEGDFSGGDLTGTAGDDVMYAGSTSGNLIGGDGSDLMIGSNSNDIFFGGAGDDRFIGGGGNDTADYGDATSGITLSNGIATGSTTGTDTLIGVRKIVGSDHVDFLTGVDSNDEFHGNDGNDVLDGGAGNDVLYGGSDNDIIHGGANDDDIFGDDGDDILYGDDGNDDIHGGAGADSIVGGTGGNSLWGDAGADKFIYLTVNNNTDDFIQDFTTGEDFIQLNSNAFAFNHGAITGGVNFAITSGYFGTNLNPGDSSEWDLGQPTLIYDSTYNGGTLFYDPDGNLNGAGYTTVAYLDPLVASDIQLISSPP